MTMRLTMRSMLTALAAAWSAASVASAQSRSPNSMRDAERRLDECWRAADWTGLERTLSDAWDENPEWAKDAAFRVINGDPAVTRPIGVAVFVARATPSELAAAADSLSPTTFQDERRLLVRAIGTRSRALGADAEIVRHVSRFAADNDAYVAAAAIQSLADLGDARSFGAFNQRLRELPAAAQRIDFSKGEMLSRSAFGAGAALSGLRPRTKDELTSWWSQTRGERQAEQTQRVSFESPEEGTRSGLTYTRTRSFDLFFEIAGMRGHPQEGAFAWPAIRDLADAAADAGSAACAPILGGTPHVPVARLYLCDQQRFAARGRQPYFRGVTKENEIAVRADPVLTLPGILTHEYIHWIHGMFFEDQPRWMSEGLAMSLTESPAESTWPMRTGDDAVERLIARGIFSELMNWNAGGSSDSLESARYQLSHIAVDFLRFGGFGASDVRLSCLMGRLARREPGVRALEQVYGTPLRDLDALARKWLGRY